MWTLVEGASTERPDEVLLSDDHGRSLTAAGLKTAAESCAAGLVERGVAPGDVVSWQLPTVLESAVLMAACSRLGAVQNPIIPMLRERELSVIARQIDPRLIVVPETWRGFDHARLANSLFADVLTLDLESGTPEAMRLPTGDPSTLPQRHDSDNCRWLYYSSGTTAEPKGARHTDASVSAASNGVIDLLGFGAGTVYPIAWPFTHIGGVAMFTAMLRAGGTLVLFDSFDPATIGERMAAHRPTVLGSATPFFHAYIAAQRRHGNEPLFGELRACVGGGAPTPAEVNREVAEVLGVRGIAGAWGLTEFPVATSETPDDREIGTSVGTPARGVQVRVVDGELRLKGPQCFLGYVDESLDTSAFDDDGWFRTGDLGSIGDDGRVHIDGRQKDVIIRNAENVSALEVEEVLLRHPAIADAGVIGVPDPRTGERICAFVVLRPDAHVDLTDLAAHCLANGLARYKLPERLETISALPRNSMGKILKNDLRILAAETNT